MPPRIALPMPHASDREYAERAVPQYERAIEVAAGHPVRIPLDRSAAEVMALVDKCDAVLLPGSKADIDPARFKAPRSPRTAPADPRRDEVDDWLLDHAYRLRKPILGICYGLQSLNVHRGGSLIQHIPDFLPQETRGKVNHEAGSKVLIAHSVEIDPNSRLAQIVRGDGRPRLSGRAKLGGDVARSTPEGNPIGLPVNSSHHQSADALGEGLRVIARCAEDGIIEALEGISPDHFVLAVQWHPERSVKNDKASLLIMRALVEAAVERSQEANNAGHRG